jgi:hypothetical protein
MSEEVLPMVGLDKTVVGSDALPRRRFGFSGKAHFALHLACARLRPKVTDGKHELSLFTQLETTLREVIEV